MSSRGRAYRRRMRHLRAGHETNPRCSCTACGNPRRHFGELTHQERRADQDDYSLAYWTQEGLWEEQFWADYTYDELISPNPDVPFKWFFERPKKKRPPTPEQREEKRKARIEFERRKYAELGMLEIWEQWQELQK